MADMLKEADEVRLLRAVQGAGKAANRMNPLKSLFNRMEKPAFERPIATATDSQTLHRIAG
jgi:hypothetical protein